MQQIAARLAQTYPDTNAEVTASVVPLRDFWFGKLRRSFWLLLGACGFVLLVVCANVANLLMTQATVRQRELAVRAALGASQGRLIRQSISEALLLISIGCAGGIVLGAWSLRLLVALLPSELLPFFVKIKLDSGVLIFTLLVSVLISLFVGLMPALRTASVDLDHSLKEGGKAGTGAGMQRVRGYRVEFMSQRYQQLLQQVAMIPGVVAVAANSDLPFVGQKPWYRTDFSIQGQSSGKRAAKRSAS
jgi:hypothetical protein